MDFDPKNCAICPRRCGADRTKRAGFCGAGEGILAAKACLHKWEEPCVSYKNGAGTVFFSGCNLHCRFCQNNSISNELFGAEISEEELAEIFIRLQAEGADNIELVTPTHFVPQIIRALDIAREKLRLPVVYNTGGYELPETIRALAGYVDVFMPDIKYFSPEVSARYSSAPDYFEYASAAVKEMVKLTGKPRFNAEGGIISGTIVRHLVLPGQRHDSIKIMEWLAENFAPDEILVSVMNQYTPFDFIPEEYPELKRRVTKMEYNSVARRAAELGLNGYTQAKSSATDAYTPAFDLTGIKKF